jgi:hypothetical protein
VKEGARRFPEGTGSRVIDPENNDESCLTLNDDVKPAVWQLEAGRDEQVPSRGLVLRSVRTESAKTLKLFLEESGEPACHRTRVATNGQVIGKVSPDSKVFFQLTAWSHEVAHATERIEERKGKETTSVGGDEL